ncbi:MAG: NUDIX domain-containing protein [Clostridia bacterium]|nr:NUDIX domain-containing protein [Clostridia bacterium]
MRNTTLCYIEKDGAYLLLHRVKKKNDVNEGKWIGIGGGLEEGETAEECLLREVREETGLTLLDYRFVGRIHFLSDTAPAEVMHLYHATAFTGELAATCNEGVLAWVKKEKASTLPMWEGDRIFLDLLEEGVPPFRLTLRYQGDTLMEAVRDEL